MEWMLMPLRRYADFEGRSRRMEFWMFQIFQMLVFGVAAVIFVALAAIAGNGAVAEVIGGLLVILIVLIAIALFIPALAVTVRRLHDQGKSGWWYLISFIPFGSIILLVFMFIDGDQGPNEYGPDPKGTGFDEETFA